MSTMLYSAELWPLTIPQKKKLDAAHHQFQRRLLGITWKDKVRNEDIRNQTKLQRMDLIIKERRLRWLGHVLHMEDDRIPKQATRWQMDSCTRRAGRPRSNWIDTVNCVNIDDRRTPSHTLFSSFLFLLHNHEIALANHSTLQVAGSLTSHLGQLSLPSLQGR